MALMALDGPACMGDGSTWLETEKGERGKIKRLPSVRYFGCMFLRTTNG